MECNISLCRGQIHTFIHLIIDNNNKVCSCAVVYTMFNHNSQPPHHQNTGQRKVKSLMKKILNFLIWFSSDQSMTGCLPSDHWSVSWCLVHTEDLEALPVPVPAVLSPHHLQELPPRMEDCLGTKCSLPFSSTSVRVICASSR